MNKPLSDSDVCTLKSVCEKYEKNNHIKNEYNAKYSVKRGLRNSDGTGVLAGLTNICNVHGYVVSEGEKTPVEGKLTYRGYNIKDLIGNCLKEDRFGYEEVAYLLLFGELPTASELKHFRDTLGCYRELPEYFAEDMIFKAPSPNIMNKLGRCVLALYSYDDNADDISLANVINQCIHLIARMPIMMVQAYQVKLRHYDKKTMVIHPTDEKLSTAESILHAIRPTGEFEHFEATIMDMCLMIHAEHGGGNNSTFANRVLASSGTDTYAAISAAIGSLKGPKHGGANLNVAKMMADIEANVSNWKDETEVYRYLKKILKKEAGDGSGLIYGMGHAVYTLSDPRAVILKQNAAKLAEQKGYGKEFELVELLEKLTPKAYAEVKHNDKVMCANVDLYSGLVYKSLGIPEDLFTPIFAVARVAGWCAHRIEELTEGKRIIRPAYKNVLKENVYVPISDR